jgi:hypothetical protein
MTPEQPEEQTFEAPCPRCGRLVDVMFKFCPACGLEMKARMVAAASDVAPPEKAKELSPEAQRALAAFENQFEDLKKKHAASKFANPPASFSVDYRVVAVLIALTLLGLFGMMYVVRYYFGIMSRAGQY